jgi:hypothetical protein
MPSAVSADSSSQGAVRAAVVAAAIAVAACFGAAISFAGSAEAKGPEQPAATSPQ